MRQLTLSPGFPERPAEFTHQLHPEGCLTLASIADLADRLPRRSVIYDTASQPLLAPAGGPPRGALENPGDVIRNLNTANAWLTLLNVEDDPEMAHLMNLQLDELEREIVAKEGKLRTRVAFLFLSSPGSVTPVHFDIEHSLLMQISGSKIVSIGCFDSDDARRHEVARYWDGSHGRMETQPRQVAAYTLTPGRAVYIPPGTPHWVRNGRTVSCSITLTYFTDATVRRNRVEDFNSCLRRCHLKPREPGRSITVDTAKVSAMGVVTLLRQLRSTAASTHRDGQ